MASSLGSDRIQHFHMTCAPRPSRAIQSDEHYSITFDNADKPILSAVRRVRTDNSHGLCGSTLKHSMPWGFFSDQVLSGVNSARART